MVKGDDALLEEEILRGGGIHEGLEIIENGAGCLEVLSARLGDVFVSSYGRSLIEEGKEIDHDGTDGAIGTQIQLNNFCHLSFDAQMSLQFLQLIIRDGPSFGRIPLKEPLQNIIQVSKEHKFVSWIVERHKSVVKKKILVAVIAIRYKELFSFHNRRLGLNNHAPFLWIGRILFGWQPAVRHIGQRMIQKEFVRVEISMIHEIHERNQNLLSHAITKRP